MHSETDFSSWDTPSKLHLSSSLYIQRGKDGFGKREDLQVPESDMFRAELELFADSCRSGAQNELTAHNGNVAVAVVNAALRSIDNSGQYVRIGDIMDEARGRADARKINVA
jgi:hypothetical protein